MENNFYRKFWLQAALYAMQGIQESGSHIGTIADFTPKILAARSFEIADAMVDELKKRFNFENDS
jgi:hypothetical protein